MAIDESEQPTSATTVQRRLPSLAQDRLACLLQSIFQKKRMQQSHNVVWIATRTGAGPDSGHVFAPVPGHWSEKFASHLSSAQLKVKKWNGKLPASRRSYSRRALEARGPVATETGSRFTNEIENPSSSSSAPGYVRYERVAPTACSCLEGALFPFL